jgi:hypothetical protein
MEAAWTSETLVSYQNTWNIKLRYVTLRVRKGGSFQVENWSGSIKTCDIRREKLIVLYILSKWNCVYFDISSDYNLGVKTFLAMRVTFPKN